MKPKGLRASLLWWLIHGTLLAGIVCVLVGLSGCQTAPIPVDRPFTPCEPLPLCSIPPKATSTQLELALWGCVLEYRAQYSSCAGRQVVP